MAFVKFLGVALLFGGMLVACVALFFGVAWGISVGPLWIAIVAGTILLLWTWLTMGRRNPNNPEDFKDFGV